MTQPSKPPEEGPAPLLARTPRRPLFDPESIPPDPAFDDPAERGSAVPADRLLADALRVRLGTPPAWQPEIRTDGRLLDLDAPLRPAAVLIPLVAHPAGVDVILTERASHLYDHAGQISFPGGRVHAQDASATATALRETEEEIGLSPAAVEIIGALPPYVTASSYQVTPIVGLIRPPFSLRPDPSEVAAAFEVPLAFLMNPANHERRLVELGGVRRTFYAMPYTVTATTAVTAAATPARRYFIWGATAAMLRNLYQLLRA